MPNVVKYLVKNAEKTGEWDLAIKEMER